MGIGSMTPGQIRKEHSLESGEYCAAESSHFCPVRTDRRSNSCSAFYRAQDCWDSTISS